MSNLSNPPYTQDDIINYLSFEMNFNLGEFFIKCTDDDVPFKQAIELGMNKLSEKLSVLRLVVDDPAAFIPEG